MLDAMRTDTYIYIYIYIYIYTHTHTHTHTVHIQYTYSIAQKYQTTCRRHSLISNINSSASNYRIEKNKIAN